MSRKKEDVRHRGHKVCDWIERCIPLVGDKLGQSIKLPTWQRLIFETIYGTLDEEGKRIIQTVYIQLPRKAAKTFIAALFILIALIAEGKGDQECYCGSWTTKNSARIFRYLLTIINSDPYLKANFRVNHGQKELEWLPTGNTFKSLSGNPENTHSIAPSVMVIDELWMFRGEKGRALYEGLTSGDSGREEPLTVIITTAGTNKQSVCHEEYQYAKKVQAKPSEDPSYLPIIYEMGEEDDPFDEANWYKAQPALYNPETGEGYVSLDKYRKVAERAKTNPRIKNSFLQLYLNRWVESSFGWIPSESWDACKTKFSLDDLNGKKAYGGFDFGLTRDLAALTLIFPMPNGKFRVLKWAWVAKGTVNERIENQDRRYAQWFENGLIRVTEGEGTDHETIERQVIEICKQFDVKFICADPMACGETLKNWRKAKLQTFEWRQSNIQATSQAAKRIESLILNKKLEHNGDEVLKWCVTNATAKTDIYDNLKIDKQCPEGRIDPLMAMVFAMGGHLGAKKVVKPGMMKL